MMLRDNGPTSSFEEDVKALGISHLFEDASKAQKPAGKQMTEQSDAAVEVIDPPIEELEQDPAEEQEKKENPFAKKNDSKADEKGDHEEPDGDEDEEGEEPEADDDEDEDAEEQEEQEEQEDDSLFDAMCDEDEKLDAAVGVIGSFYDTLSESEDGGEFDHDALVGVIEAYEYIAEVTGLLDEAVSAAKRRSAKRAGRLGTRKAARMRKAGRVKQSTKKAHAKGKVILGGKQVRGTKAATTARAREMYRGAEGSKGKKRARAAMQRIKTSDVEETGSPITELVDNLAALKEAVQTNVSYRRQAEELKEGFNAIGETASAWMESIATEVKKSVAEDKDYDAEEDPRVLMGRHLDGIAESAAQIISKLDEGEADLNDAASDLQALSADLNDAAEATKGIA